MNDKLVRVYEAALALKRSSPMMSGRPMVAVGADELEALFAAVGEIPIQQQQYVPREGEAVVNWLGLPGTIPPVET